MQIKAVIFDYGGVMRAVSKIPFSGFEEKHGLEVGVIFETQKASDIVSLFHDMEVGEVSLEEYEEAFTRLYMEKTQLKFSNRLCIISELGTNTERNSPAMINAVKLLRAHGYKTALLTNNFYMDRSKTKSLLPIDTSLFDVVVESCRVGIKKPDPEIYDITLKKLGCLPGEVVYLDDNEGNVNAASAMGIKSIKVPPCSPETVIPELENIVDVKLRES